MRSRAKQGQKPYIRQVGKRKPTDKEQKQADLGRLRLQDGKVPIFTRNHPESGSARGNKRRAKAEDAFIEQREQVPLTNWQSHQWEAACNKAPRVRKMQPDGSVRMVRKALDRYPFAKLERRTDAHPAA